MQIAGTLIAGKYRVSKKLGEGAMGSVWLATNQVTDREFAIKVLLPAAASEPAGLSRFFREARVCGGLRHPSIVEIYDAGTAPELDGAPYLVMERLLGAALDVVVRQRGALAPALAVDIVAQCARGLHLAHQKGVVHRDLKPANIFLHRPGTGALVPKVLDFGISKVVGTPEIALTQSSTVLGSPLYMSPEQMETKTLDARSDVHALGVVLWECLAGAPPFSSTSYNTLVVEIMRGPRPRLRDVMPTLSPELAAIVERAFAMDRAERFASADELADALEAQLAILGGSPLTGRTAAVDLLSSLDLTSRPPPPKFSSTTQPLSVDPGAARRPAPSFGAIAVAPQSDAFQETLPAPPTEPRPAPVPAAVAVSAIEPRPRRPTSLQVTLIAGGAVAAAATLGLLLHGPAAPDPRSPGDPVATAEVPARPNPSTTTPPASAAVAPPSASSQAAGDRPPNPPLSSSRPAAALSPPVAAPRVVFSPPPAPPSPTATARPAASVAPPKLRGAPSASATARPRIDESGL